MDAFCSWSHQFFAKHFCKFYELIPVRFAFQFCAKKMPSAEPSGIPNGDQHDQQALEPHQQQQQNPDVTAQPNGTAPMEDVEPDPDRHLIPADRIEHVEDAEAPIDLPTVREFTQNDKINKFLLNSFLQRLNDTDLDQFNRGNDANGDLDQDQDFEA